MDELRGGDEEDGKERRMTPPILYVWWDALIEGPDSLALSLSRQHSQKCDRRSQVLGSPSLSLRA